MLQLIIFNISSSFLYLLLMPPCTTARYIPEFTTIVARKNSTWININHTLLNSHRGSHVIGISEIEKYFQHYGYLQTHRNNETNDIFDEKLEDAVKKYQSTFGLTVTGKFNPETIDQIITPRCGVADVDKKTNRNKWHVSKNYVLFPGKPRWTRGGTPMKLTYGFSKDYLIKYINFRDIKAVFRRAFVKWAKAIPVIFVESNDYVSADIQIGFYSGDHGDGEPFDGVLGVLAHSFSPESGRFHLDADETWAVDFKIEKSPNAVDLESVAMHEIGHLLGLAHSYVKGAVMFPSLKPRKRKVDLTVDDIEGVQALYGSNRNFTFSELLASDTLENRAVDVKIDSCRLMVSFLLCLFLII
ncbi:hypothetical protein ACFE04_016781 [Oxalis oulophora]